MRTLLPFCLTILLSAFICGCRQSAAARLFDGIEAAIADNPDSALAMLDSIDTTRLTKAADMARYHLLMAEARYKHGLDDTTTVHVGPAVDYYKDHGPRHDAARAYFYSGIVKYNQKRYASAAVDLLRAERVAKDDKDTLQLAFIYRAMGDNFYEVKDFKSSLSYYKSSFEYFKKKEADKYTAYTPLDIARCYLALNDNSQAIKYALLSYKYGKENNDTSLMAYSLGFVGAGYFYIGDYHKAIKTYSDMEKLGIQFFRNNDYYRLGSIYFHFGDSYNAKIADQKLDSAGYEPNMLKFHLLLNDGKYDDAIAALYHNLDVQNKALEQSWSTNLASEVISYEQNEELLIRTSNQHERIFWICIMLLSILSILLICILIQKRNRVLKLERDSYMIAIDDLNKTINSINALKKKSESQLSMEVGTLKNVISDSQNAIRKLLAARFTDISELCQVYFQHDIQKNAQLKVFDKVRNLVYHVNSDPKFRQELEVTIDLSLSGLISKFKKDFPNLNEWEYPLFMYSVCSIESKTIALFMQQNTNLIYKRKANLKKKISNSKSPFRDEYLSYFK